MYHSQQADYCRSHLSEAQAKNFYEVEMMSNVSHVLKRKEKKKEKSKGVVKFEHQILILNLFSSLQIINTKRNDKPQFYHYPITK